MSLASDGHKYSICPKNVLLSFFRKPGQISEGSWVQFVSLYSEDFLCLF